MFAQQCLIMLEIPCLPQYYYCFLVQAKCEKLLTCSFSYCKYEHNFVISQVTMVLYYFNFTYHSVKQVFWGTSAKALLSRFRAMSQLIKYLTSVQHCCLMLSNQHTQAGLWTRLWLLKASILPLQPRYRQIWRVFISGQTGHHTSRRVKPVAQQQHNSGMNT